MEPYGINRVAIIFGFSQSTEHPLQVVVSKSSRRTNTTAAHLHRASTRVSIRRALCRLFFFYSEGRQRLQRGLTTALLPPGARRIYARTPLPMRRTV